MLATSNGPVHPKPATSYGYGGDAAVDWSNADGKLYAVQTIDAIPVTHAILEASKSGTRTKPW